MTAAAQLVKVIQVSEICAIFLYSLHQKITFYGLFCSLFPWNWVGRALSLCLMTLILIKVSATKSNLTVLIYIAFMMSRHDSDLVKL